jgi:hypothetical protein
MAGATRTFEYYEKLNKVIQEAPTDSAAIRIVKGKPFAPDARTKTILTDAAAIGDAAARAISYRPRDEAFYFYPGQSA